MKSTSLRAFILMKTGRSFKIAKGFKKESAEDPSFAEIVAYKICSGHNQNSIILFNGKPGSVKSLESIHLAFDLS